jgi:RNA polymerase sigma-70 factor (ECF subfamily)
LAVDDIGNLTEEELLCRAQGGSSACFGALTQRHRPRLLSLLAHRRLPLHDAEDVVQETFVRAYAALPSYRPVRPFGAWLTTIALNVAASERRRPRAASVDDLDRADPSPAPADSIEVRQERENLWETARRALSPRQYEALYLRHAREMSVRQIAQSMGLFEVHVKVLLYRARRALASCEQFRSTARRLGSRPADGGVR